MTLDKNNISLLTPSHIDAHNNWVNTFGKAMTYMYSKQPDEIMKKWITQQHIDYDEGTMHESTRDMWSDFANVHDRYFRSNVDIWRYTLSKVTQYLDEDSTPYSKHLGNWIISQNVRYQLKIYAMQYPEIRTEWKQFVFNPRYDKFFRHSSEKMVIILDRVTTYIDKNSRLPLRTDEERESKNLGLWIAKQILNYSYMVDNMTVPSIRHEWECFIRNPLYSRYFKA
jgi:hypothetical protein